MLNNSQRVSIDVLRTLAYTGIGISYEAVGAKLGYPTRIVCITNTTDADMIFSTDNSTSMLYVPSGTFKLFDLNTNRQSTDISFCFAPGTQFYVKQNTMPSKGAVYIECIYGDS